MSGKIRFFTENLSYVIRRKRTLREWLLFTMANEGQTAGEINIILCDDAYLLALNLRYLKHKTLTDILTFAFNDEPGIISGDIYISLPRVTENAVKFRQKTEDELHRVMVHGVLHLAGYTDGTPSEKATMRSKEDQYLKVLADQCFPAARPELAEAS